MPSQSAFHYYELPARLWARGEIDLPTCMPKYVGSLKSCRPRIQSTHFTQYRPQVDVRFAKGRRKAHMMTSEQDATKRFVPLLHTAAVLVAEVKTSVGDHAAC